MIRFDFIGSPDQVVSLIVKMVGRLPYNVTVAVKSCKKNIQNVEKNLVLHCLLRSSLLWIQHRSFTAKTDERGGRACVALSLCVIRWPFRERETEDKATTLTHMFLWGFFHTKIYMEKSSVWNLCARLSPLRMASKWANQFRCNNTSNWSIWHGCYG